MHNPKNLCYTAVVATIAQLVVHLIRNQKVTGSSPVCGRKVKQGSLTSLFFLFFSAIMEQSIVIGIYKRRYCLNPIAVKSMITTLTVCIEKKFEKSESA